MRNLLKIFENMGPEQQLKQ